MEDSQLTVVRGVTDKPVSADTLKRKLEELPNEEGAFYVGFPMYNTSEGKYTVDALYLSPRKGLIVFDLIEGLETGNYHSRQDDAANIVESKLKSQRELTVGRRLLVPINTISFGPLCDTLIEDQYKLSNPQTLHDAINQIKDCNLDYEIYKRALSTIQTMSNIRKGKSKRVVQKPDSKGAKLKKLEDSIATLDNLQGNAVIQTVKGVQRIRGLAGSGKTIVLALKAAYLHSQYPEWKIAVTFNTRALKGQFKRLIESFLLEKGIEPDWENLKIINAWGAPGNDERDGIYHQYCKAHSVPYMDYAEAKSRFGPNNAAVQGACNQALSETNESQVLYDVILVDEAQDFPPIFLKLCYQMLDKNKRLVYAYDELQNLSGFSLPPPEEIFGYNEKGAPIVTFDDVEDESTRDIILKICYRNSRPVLVTAHALGFGIYRKVPKGMTSGLVQMFDYPMLWEEIGYEIKDGQLEEGHNVTLARTPTSSPAFLENQFDIDDLISFIKFDTKKEQAEYLVSQIKENIENDELKFDDIVVINPDPFTTRNAVGPIRGMLFSEGINSHLAGVDTNPDIFFKTEDDSITFTGIYRAKGNEAGMVYIINAQDCNTSLSLSTVRNRLFTAITRSKAWVRVLGVGDGMQSLIDEYNCLRENNYELDFKYPTEAERKKLMLVHRDVSLRKKKQLDKYNQGMKRFIERLDAGDLSLEDLDEDTLEKLKQYITKRD